METPDRDDETYETIPWAQLAPAATPLATRLGYWVVGALVAVVLAYVLVAVLRDEPDQTLVRLDAPPPAVSPGVAAAVVTTTTPTDADVEAPSAVAYSEADLMAVVPEEDQRAAAARAVWFVTDYFTIDGDVQTADDVRAALPQGIDVVLPHDEPAGVSYVEWAHALAVRPDGPGRYAVDVAFRALQGSGDAGVTRQPVTAVRVRMAIMPDGTVAVRDLPEPLPLSVASVEVARPPAADPPPEILARLASEVSAVGSPGDILEAGVDTIGWRILLSVDGPFGLSWPLAVRP
jgi:hypothetical protein